MIKVDEILRCFPLFIKSVDEYEDMIENEKIELSKMYALYDRVQTTLFNFNSDYEKLEDMKQVFKIKIKQLKDVVFNIELALLNSTDGDFEYKIIYKKYFDDKTWEEVADEFNISRATVYRIRKNVFRKLEFYFILFFGKSREKSKKNKELTKEK